MSSFKKRFFRILIPFCIFALFILGFLPLFLSSTIGSRFLISSLKEYIGGEMTVETIKLSWLQGQYFKNVHYSNLEKGIELTIPQLTIDRNLWKIIFSGFNFERMDISTPSLKFIPSSKKSRPQQTVAKKAKKKKKGISLPLKGMIYLSSGMASLERKNYPSIEFLHIEMQLELPKLQLLNISGHSLQGELSGVFNIKSEMIKNMDAYQFFAHMEHFPLLVMDELLSIFYPQREGLLADLFGDFLDLQGKGIFKEDAFSLSGNAHTPKFHANIDTSLKDNLINIALRAVAKETLQGTIELNGTVKKILTPFGKIDRENAHTNIDLKLHQFPMAFIDLFCARSLSFILGQTASANLTYEGTLKQGNLAMSASTDLFNISSLLFDVGSKLELKSPSSFQYLLQPEIVEGFLNQETFKLKNASMVDGTLESFSFPLFQAKKELDIQGSLKIPSLNFSRFSHFDRAEIHDIAFSAQTKNNAISFKGGAALHFLNRNNPYAQLIDSPLQIGLDGNMLQTHIFEIPEVTVSLKSKAIQTEILGEVHGKDLLFGIKKPAALQYILTREAFSNFIDIPLKLDDNVPISLEISRFTLPLKGIEIQKAVLNLLVNIQKMQLNSTESPSNFLLSNPSFALNFNGPAKNAEIQLASNVIDHAGHEGEFLVKLKPSDFDLAKEKSLWKGTFDNQVYLKSFSTEFFSTWLRNKIPLSSLIGSSMDGEIHFKKAQNTRSSRVLFFSPLAHFEGDFLIDPKSIMSKNPLKFKWDITPQGYNALEKLWIQRGEKFAAPLELANTASLNMEVSSFSLPLKEQDSEHLFQQILFPTISWNLDEMILRALVKIRHLEIDKGNTSLDHLDVKIKKTSTEKPFIFDLKGNVISRGKKGLINADGQLQKDTLACQAKIDQFPTAILDTLTHMVGIGFEPSALFGDTLNASLITSIKNFTGTLNGLIDASYCKAEFDAIFVQGRMLLQKPIKSTLTLNQKLVNTLIKNISITDITSRKPIELYIEDRGFSLPIKPYNPRNIQIPHITLNLDKLSCRNKELTAIFKEKGRISLWFAPMDIHVLNGIMQIERTEILYNNAYQIATWGNILFPKKYVNMTLGLTAQSLASAFGLKNIPANYVLQIPIKGPFGNVKIQKEEASTKIAALVARQAAGGIAKGAGGIWGEIIGGVIEGMSDDQNSVPPPKPPFPWQSNSNQTSDASVEIPKKYSSIKHSFKDIQKLIAK